MKKSISLQSLGDRISRTQKLLAMTTSILLGTLGIAFFGIYQSWQQNRLQLEKQYGLERNRMELLSKINDNRQHLEKLEARLLLTEGDVTDKISRLADKSGIQIELITPQPDVSLGLYSESQLQVIATATFPDLLQFLRSLEQHDPLLKIDQLEIGEPTSQLPQGPFRTYERLKTFSIENDRQKVKLLVGAFSKSTNTP